MAVTIDVLCRSVQPLTRQEIMDFICDGVFFEQEPRFSPSPGSEEAGAARWSFLEVDYQTGKRPVQIVQYEEGMGELADIRQEAIDELVTAELTSTHADLIEHLQASRRVFVIEISALDVPEECWEMVDAVEAFLARTLTGVVHTSDGFYNQSLQVICSTDARARGRSPQTGPDYPQA